MSASAGEDVNDAVGSTPAPTATLSDFCAVRPTASEIVSVTTYVPAVA